MKSENIYGPAKLGMITVVADKKLKNELIKGIII